MATNPGQGTIYDPKLTKTGVAIGGATTPGSGQGYVQGATNPFYAQAGAVQKLAATPTFARSAVENQYGKMSDSQYYGGLASQAGNTSTGALASNLARKAVGLGGSSGGGGGGGGGGAAAPTMTQDQLNAVLAMLNGGRPQDEALGAAYNPGSYNAPQITPFDPSMYDQLLGNFNTAVTNDRGTAQQAYGDLTNYLQTNNQNAYANPGAYAQMGNAPGQTQQAMARMLQSQGQNANQLMQPARSDAQGADQAFGNLLSILSGNESQAQQNRLNQVQMDQGYTNRALDMAALQGQTGIGMQKGQAQQAWQQRADDRSYGAYNNQFNSQQQAALANWQRQNSVADSNYANQNSYNNTALSSFLSTLLPQIIQGGLQMPAANQLFPGAQ